MKAKAQMRNPFDGFLPICAATKYQPNSERRMYFNKSVLIRVPASPAPTVIFSLKYHIKFSYLHFKRLHCYRAATADAAATVGFYSRQNACLNDALALVIMWKQLQKSHQMFLPKRTDIINGAYIAIQNGFFPALPFTPRCSCSFTMSLRCSLGSARSVSSYSNMSRSIYGPWIHITILLSRSTI